MRRFLLAALLTTLPVPALAADRTVSVTTFSRVRIEGSFMVRILTGASPAARVSGDPDVIERIDVAQNGETLIIRVGGPGWGERPSAKATRPVTITLGTPRLDGVAMGGEADVHVGAMKGPRIDLTVTGAGKLAVERIDADQLVATVVGSGVITADAGKVTAMRAMVNGPGAVAAPELAAGDLIARVEGPGEVTVAARFTAQVTATGLGKVSVLGTPKCQVRAPAGAAVTCGG